MLNDTTLSSDNALLKEYARSQDPEAFAELARRYAGLVYGTCMRVLQSDDDAQDVSQECFLELARKAGRIRSSLPAYLHLLAKTRSVDAIRRSAARRRNEQEAAMQTADTPDPSWSEIAPFVDEALASLPDRLRVPIVLHYLQGRTQAQVAAELGVNQSSVSRSIDKGIIALRESLKKAGVMVTVGSLMALLSKNAATAAPSALIGSLGKIAISGAGAGSGALAWITGSVAGKCLLGILIVGVLLAARPLYRPSKVDNPTSAYAQETPALDLAAVLKGCKKAAQAMRSGRGTVTGEWSVPVAGTERTQDEYTIAFQGEEFICRLSRENVGTTAPSKCESVEAYDGVNVSYLDIDEHRGIVRAAGRLPNDPIRSSFANLFGNAAANLPVSGVCDLSELHTRYREKKSNVIASRIVLAGEDTIRGDRCAVVECSYDLSKPSGKRVREIRQFWVNIDKGYTLSRLWESFEGGGLAKREVYRKIEFETRLYPGNIWGPGRSEECLDLTPQIAHAVGEPAGSVRSVWEFRSDFQLNVPITNAELTFTFPKGTHVRNKVTKTDFVVR